MNRQSLACCLTAALAVFALAPRPAHAIFYASEFTQLANFGELLSQTGQLGKQYTELQNQLTKLKEQYDQFNLGGFTLSGFKGYRAPMADFPKRPENYGMDKRCKLGKSSVAQEQYNLCGQIVIMENKRYNVLAQMLEDVHKRDQEIQRILSDRSGLDQASGKGKLDANTNAVHNLQAQMENDIQNAKQTLDAYDTVVRTLKSEQTRLAQAALSNKNELLGAVVQGGLLKLGLKEARNRRKL